MASTAAVEAVRPPTPKQVDALVKEYAEAQKLALADKATATASQAKADEVKGRVIDLVQLHGARHTEKSRRIAGLHTSATITTGTYTAVDAAKVESFRTYLAKEEFGDLPGRFFVAETTYRMVDGPQEVLKGLSLTAKIRNKVTSLLAQCFEIKTKAPSLKIDVVEPETPAKLKLV